MNSKNIKIGQFYRLKNSPNYGYVKPIEILKPKQGENINNYTVVKCEHVVQTGNNTGFVRCFRLSDIIEDKK